METTRHLGIPDAHFNGRRAGGEQPVTRKASHSRVIPGIVAVVLITGAVAAWHFVGASGKPDASATASGVLAPVTVNVQTIKEQKLRLWNDFSGRLRAIDSAEIRPEVSGRITEVRFGDGQPVEAGDILMVIEPRPYEAAEARAEARVASTNCLSE